jgi:hypothetical protein
MAKSVDMDENVKFTDQIKEDVSPVVFINKIEVNPQDVDHFLKAWKSDADFVWCQMAPGLIFRFWIVTIPDEVCEIASVHNPVTI